MSVFLFEAGRRDKRHTSGGAQDDWHVGCSVEVAQAIAILWMTVHIVSPDPLGASRRSRNKRTGYSPLTICTSCGYASFMKRAQPQARTSGPPVRLQESKSATRTPIELVTYREAYLPRMCLDVSGTASSGLSTFTNHVERAVAFRRESRPCLQSAKRWGPRRMRMP